MSKAFLQISRAIAGNTDFLTAQSFVFPKNLPEDQSEGVLNLNVLICASGDDVFTKVRQTQPQIEENFFASEEPLPNRLPALLDLLKKELASFEDLKILLSAIKDNVLYLIFTGNVSAYLLRNDKTIALTEEKPPDQLISGYLTDSDKLLLLSPNEDSPWEEPIVQKLLNASNDSLEEEITSIIQSTPNLPPLAAILIKNGSSQLPAATIEKIDSFQRPISFNLSFLKNINLPKRTKIAALILVILILSSSTYFLYRHFKPKLQNSSSSQSQSDQKPTEDPKIHQLSDFPLFLSLDLIKKDFSTQRFSYSLQKALLLDDKEKTLVSLDLNSKKNTILAGRKQLGEAQFASLNGANAFVYSEDKGILKIDTENQNVVTVAKPDPEWGKISDIFGFGGNVYALDSLKNQIWKYFPTTSGYSEKNAYLKEGQNLNFAGATRLVIDYSVWVLKPEPEVFRFTSGNSDNFSVGGLEKHLQKLNSFYVGEGGDEGPTSENSFAYFLDSENSRLVVLKKNGQYEAQYTGDKFKTASDFAVDEQTKKLYLLESGKIYQIDLK